MSREEIKRIFFELLTEDEEFKQRLTEFILSAVAEKFVERVAQVEEPPKSEDVVQEKYSPEFIQKVAEHSGIDKLSGDKKIVEEQRDELSRQLESLRKEKNTAESQRDELNRQLESLRKEKNTAESQRDELSRQLETVYKEKESAEKQLAERFAEGWEVYQTFLKLNAEVRENSGFRAEKFETFICKGAQRNSLDGIWEAALDCKRAEKIDDARIFWNVFEYFVQLVNFAFGDNFIEILNTQIGDRYNTDIHSTSGTNSSTQGVVREVILAGYRNNNSKKIVKKSNVRVG